MLRDSLSQGASEWKFGGAGRVIVESTSNRESPFQGVRLKALYQFPSAPTCVICSWRDWRILLEPQITQSGEIEQSVRGNTDGQGNLWYSQFVARHVAPGSDHMADGFLAMTTDQPIPVAPTDLSVFLAATAGVMDVRDITEGVPPGNSIRLRGRL